MVTKKKTTTPETESEAPVKKPRATRKKKETTEKEEPKTVKEVKAAKETKTAKKPRTTTRKKKVEPATTEAVGELVAATLSAIVAKMPKEAIAAPAVTTEVEDEAEETPQEDTYITPEVHTYLPISLSKPEPTLEPQPEPETETEAETAATAEAAATEKKPEHKQNTKPVPPCPTLLIQNIVELINAPQRQLLINDQQIQQLTVEEAEKRFRWIEGTLALVLNYDVVLSDTNIWIELLTGHTSSHSDPHYNCRLQFERQLEFISKLTSYRRGRFMMMSETYEEIDRFATQMDPVSHREADFSDEAVCRNIAGRLAKRLILSQQRENRLRIEGIGSESHHGSFADPAIIRRCVELFAVGKKVLLLTNDASVAIRAMGMCDDLQRTNNIEDEEWDETYAPLRPMVMTFDDLKVIDAYTRQYHFLQMAAGKSFMEDVPNRMEKRTVEPLTLWLEGFRPGDRHSEKKMQQKQQQNQQKQNNNQPKQQQQQQQPKQQQNNQPKQQQNNQPKQQAQQPKQEQPKQQAHQPKQEQPKQEQPKQEPKQQAQQPKQESKSQQPKQEPKSQQPKQDTPQLQEQPMPQEQSVSQEQLPSESPKPSLISPEEASLNEEEKKQEQKQKRRNSRRSSSRKPKGQNAAPAASTTQAPAPATTQAPAPATTQAPAAATTQAPAPVSAE